MTSPATPDAHTFTPAGPPGEAGRCGSCRHFDGHDTRNGYGYCNLFNAEKDDDWQGGGLAIAVALDFGSADLRVRPAFGCVLWESR